MLALNKCYKKSIVNEFKIKTCSKFCDRFCNV